MEYSELLRFFKNNFSKNSILCTLGFKNPVSDEQALSYIADFCNALKKGNPPFSCVWVAGCSNCGITHIHIAISKLKQNDIKIFWNHGLVSKRKIEDFTPVTNYMLNHDYLNQSYFGSRLRIITISEL